MYATVADLRAEGVTTATADDARLTSLIEEAGQTIDRITGWFFEPRLLTLRLEGRGRPTIQPPFPPIRLDRLTVKGVELPLTPADIVIVGAPVCPGFSGPRITLRHRVFPLGQGNVEIEGLWGYTEPDGTAPGRTPLPRRPRRPQPNSIPESPRKSRPVSPGKLALFFRGIIRAFLS